MHNDAPTQDRL